MVVVVVVVPIERDFDSLVLHIGVTVFSGRAGHTLFANSEQCHGKIFLPLT